MHKHENAIKMLDHVVNGKKTHTSTCSNENIVINNILLHYLRRHLCLVNIFNFFLITQQNVNIDTVQQIGFKY